MEINDNIDLEKETGGTVFAYNDEDKFYRDVIIQIKSGKSRIYIYNKKILDRVQKKYPNIPIKRRDFYWEVINNETKYSIA